MYVVRAVGIPNRPASLVTASDIIQGGAWDAAQIGLVRGALGFPEVEDEIEHFEDWKESGKMFTVLAQGSPRL